MFKFFRTFVNGACLIACNSILIKDNAQLNDITILLTKIYQLCFQSLKLFIANFLKLSVKSYNNFFHT